jgi:hypothetical protein
LGLSLVFAAIEAPEGIFCYDDERKPIIGIESFLYWTIEP